MHYYLINFSFRQSALEGEVETLKRSMANLRNKLSVVWKSSFSTILFQSMEQIKFLLLLPLKLVDFFHFTCRDLKSRII